MTRILISVYVLQLPTLLTNADNRIGTDHIGQHMIPAPILTSADNSFISDDFASKLMIRIFTSVCVLPFPTFVTSADNRIGADLIGQQIIPSAIGQPSHKR